MTRKDPLDDLLSSVLEDTGEKKSRLSKDKEKQIWKEAVAEEQDPFVPVEDRGKRDLIYSLNTRDLYICEATIAKCYEMRNKDIVRITLTDVVMRTYDTSVPFAELPALGLIQEVNAVRKRQGLEYQNLTEGTRQVFI